MTSHLTKISATRPSQTKVSLTALEGKTNAYRRCKVQTENKCRTHPEVREDLSRPALDCHVIEPPSTKYFRGNLLNSAAKKKGAVAQQRPLTKKILLLQSASQCNLMTGLAVRCRRTLLLGLLPDGRGTAVHGSGGCTRTEQTPPFRNALTSVGSSEVVVRLLSTEVAFS